jgi:pSer/pThr/pTyr-binding forkhead associated (FHA) protein
MSLNRFVYYCAVTGGWAALVAWLAAELFLFRAGNAGSGLPAMLRDTLTAAIVGGAIGAGLAVVSGMTNAQWEVLLKRAGPGLLGGLVGGGLGGFLGGVLYSYLHAPRALGWLIMGVGIGATEGLYERSARKIRNGLIGGSIGGLLGGLLFDPIVYGGSHAFGPSGYEMSARATALVILGISVGVFIGLAHVVLKEAWLTVLDGYRPGRQLILSRDVTILGRAEHLPLPFLGHADSDLEPEHVRISRRPDGQYVAEENETRVGTLVNSQPMHGPVVLRDGDRIKLGTNIVRFNHRRRGAERAVPQARDSQNGSKRPIAPPPPPPIAFPAGSSEPPLTPLVPSVPDASEPAGPGSNGGGATGGTTPTPGVGPMRPPPPPPR